MSRTLNKVQLIGRLGANPELRYTQSGSAVASFNLATNHYVPGSNGQEGREDTDWHRIVLWDKLAETANEYLTKGSQVYIEGRIQNRTWEDQQGQKRYTTEVVGQTMIMLDTRSGGSEDGGGGVGRASSAPVRTSKQTAQADEPELEGEELPF